MGNGNSPFILAGVLAGAVIVASLVLLLGLSAGSPTEAAAILRSINPKLNAAEIKDLLVKTASEDVFVSGNRPIEVDKSVGGRVLRVDNAVYKVIGDMLGGKVPDRATLQKMAKI